MRDIGGVGGHHLVWGGPQRGYLDNGKSRTSTGTVCHQSPDHHYHSYFPVPKGINMTAPPNHPDPIYAGFSRPFERNPTTRVATQHHRGGESVDPTEISTSLQSLDSLIRTVYCSNSTYHSLH